MTHETAIRRQEQLAAMRALEGNAAWQELVAMLKQRQNTHQEGLRDRAKTPAQRAEHVEASHLVDELLSYARDRIEGCERDLREWAARQGRE